MSLQTRLRRLEAKADEAITAEIQALLDELKLEPFLPAALATPAGQALQIEWERLANEAGCTQPADLCLHPTVGSRAVQLVCDLMELAARIKWPHRDKEYGA